MYDESYWTVLSSEIDARVAAENREQLEPARPGLWAPFAGATILLNGESYWGLHHVAGVYVRDGDLARRAQKVLVERAHTEALRRNDWLDRGRVRFKVTAAGYAVLGKVAERGDSRPAA
jgi:hypothetical protein